MRSQFEKREGRRTALTGGATGAELCGEKRRAYAKRSKVFRGRERENWPNRNLCRKLKGARREGGNRGEESTVGSAAERFLKNHVAWVSSIHALRNVDWPRGATKRKKKWTMSRSMLTGTGASEIILDILRQEPWVFVKN